MLVSPNVNHEIKMADEILRIDEKIGIALEMTKDTIQNKAPRPIHRVQVNVLWTFTCSGFAARIIVMYYVDVNLWFPL